MAIGPELVDIGLQGNDGTGDSIRESFRKINANFVKSVSITSLELAAEAVAEISSTGITPLITVMLSGNGTVKLPAMPEIVGAQTIIRNRTPNSHTLTVKNSSDQTIRIIAPNSAAQFAYDGFSWFSISSV